MEPAKEYILRTDVYPLVDKEGKREAGLLEVHLYRFNNLDDAFLHLYSIPVNAYDKDKALEMGERFFIDRASITSPGLPHPLMEIEKPHRRAAVAEKDGIIYLNKGESHELLSSSTLTLFGLVNLLELGTPRMPIAQYKIDGAILAPFKGVSRDTVLGLRMPAESADKYTPFSVAIRSSVFGDKIPEGVKPGTTVLEVSRHSDLREAFTELITRTDLNQLDPMVAFNSRLGKAISSAELSDKKSGQRLAQLLTVHYDGMVELIPKAGAYLRFEGHLPRYLIENMVPQLSHLKMDPQDYMATIGHYDEKFTRVIETEGYRTLKTEMASLYQRLDILHARERTPRSDSRQNKGNRPLHKK